MNTTARIAMVLLAAGLGGSGVAARAEPTLRYKYGYVCNKERVVVAHCRHDSDMPGVPPTAPEDDYCQVYYPDRPKTGGFEAMGIELRGDLIKNLQACGAFGATAPTPGGNAKAGSTSTDAGPAPTRPRDADSQAGSGAQTQKQFCDQILQLRSLAPQGFRSIDLGPKQGEPVHIHATSIRLVTTDDVCFIGRKEGERPYYLCSWNVFDDATNAYDDARIDAVGNMLASCLNERADWSEKNGVYSLKFNTQGAEYSLDVLAGALLLSIQPAQPNRPSATPTNPAAAPARPENTATPGGSKTEMRQQFCTQIAQLRSLAPQEFNSIDLGRMKGEKSPDIHAAAINLPSANDCHITRRAGKRAEYSCYWPLSADKGEAQFRGLGNLLASCLNVRPDWSLMNDVGVWQLSIDTTGVTYFFIGEHDFMALTIWAAAH